MPPASPTPSLKARPPIRVEARKLAQLLYQAQQLRLLVAYLQQGTSFGAKHVRQTERN